MEMFAHEFVCLCVCVGHSLFGEVHLNDALQGVNVRVRTCVSALGC